MILREKYLQEIEHLIDQPIIKVILGMRRVGKSTLLMQIQDHLKNNGVKESQIIHLNFEWMLLDEIKTPKELHQLIKAKMTTDEKYYIFLDEIQEVEGFERVVNSLNSQGQADIYITGSNSKLLSSELATYLTGRYYTIEVLPLSFKEYMIDKRNEDVDKIFFDYLRFGGLPGLLMFKDESVKRNLMMDVYHSLLLKDVVGRFNIRDTELFQRFMQYVMNNIGQIFSANTITKFLKSEGRKLSKETIYNYLDAAKSAYLVHNVKRYNLKGKEILRTSEKYFINDLGLRALYYNNEADIGQALENIIYLELRRRGFELYVGQLDKKEVDFIAIKGDKKIYYQVCYVLAEPSTIEREFSVLEAIDDNYEKFVLSLDKVNRSRSGIIHQNIIEFLLEDVNV